MSTTIISDNTSNISSEFELFNSKTNFLDTERKVAMDAFNKLGFPTTKNEEWKYTSVNKIASQKLNFNESIFSRVNKDLVDSFRIGGSKACVLVFENGIFNERLSDKFPSQAGVIVGNLDSNISQKFAEKYLGKIAAYSNESFVALNMAFISDGIVVHVEEGQKLNQLVHFMHISSSEKSAAVSTVRNLVVAEKNSKLHLVESYHSTKTNSGSLTNSVTEVLVKENATVELVKAQLESADTTHVSFTQAVQEKNSTFDTVTVTLSGGLVRNNLHIRLDDVNCTSHLFGLYILDGEQVVDNHTLVDHAKPNCFSNELYKGIIGGKASGVFNGKIFVRKDAQKTNAYQSNKNILLSDDAQMNTKPQLEIFADDVKCTHGATTGQMDEDALFYLRARGIGEKNAKALLNIAFAGDVLDNIKSGELKDNLLKLAVEKLHQHED